MNIRLLLVALLLIAPQVSAERLLLDVRKGLRVSIFASGVPGSYWMTKGGNNQIFIASPAKKKIYALVDSSNNGRADKKIVIDSNLRGLQGISYLDGSLYAVVDNAIYRYDNIEQFHRRPTRKKWLTTLPQLQTPQSIRFLKAGQDGWLYIGIDAGCNACIPIAPNGGIFRINPLNKEMQQVAQGARNPGSIAWHPQIGDAWFVDSGRDWMGDDLPYDEINRISYRGEHFGFPYIHGKSVLEPSLTKPAQLKTTAPVMELPAHVTPRGMTFYKGPLLEEGLSLIVVEHGSTNRSSKVGYRVTSFKLNQDNSLQNAEIMIDFYSAGKIVGRPSDVLALDDGSILISDNKYGRIYKVTRPIEGKDN